MMNEKIRDSKCIFGGWTMKQLEERRSANKWEECKLSF